MTNRKTGRRLLRAAVRTPGAYALLAFLSARRVLVSGGSMHPALRAGERVLFDRLAYLVRAPRRGDIVLAAHPARPGLRMVKRIAAGPGELFAPDAGHSVLLAPGEYALVGDAPGQSTDSRQLGPVRRRDILARAWIVYWPPQRFRRL